MCWGWGKPWSLLPPIGMAMRNLLTTELEKKLGLRFKATQGTSQSRAGGSFFFWLWITSQNSFQLWGLIREHFSAFLTGHLASWFLVIPFFFFCLHQHLYSILSIWITCVGTHKLEQLLSFVVKGWQGNKHMQPPLLQEFLILPVWL